MTDAEIDKIDALVFKLTGLRYTLDHNFVLIKALEVGLEAFEFVSELDEATT